MYRKPFTTVLAGSVMFGVLFMGALANTAWAEEVLPIQIAPIQIAQASPTPSMKIRVVSIEGIRAQSTAFKEARDKILAYGTTQNQAFQKEDKDLRKASDELNRKRTLLDPEVFADERKKFEQRVAAFQSRAQEHQKTINKLKLEALGKVNDKIIQIIAEYAKAEGVSLVLPSQSVLLRAESIDMDGYVLERLNKELPSVTVSLPAQ